MRRDLRTHPVFDARLSLEALEAHMRDLSVLPLGGDRRPPQIAPALRALRRAYVDIAGFARDGEELISASAWVLDNFPFLEEKMVDAAREARRLRSLPAFLTGEVRAYRLMREAVAHTDATLDLSLLSLCAGAYQSLRSLRMRELWALPPLACAALLEAAAHIACLAAAAQRDRIRAENYAKRLLEGDYMRLPAGDLHNPIIIERISARLREEESGGTLALLDSQLGELEMDRDRLIASAHMRQSLWQLRIANAIQSLRALSACDWNVQFEELSSVENALRAERSGIYPQMDFASRDALRGEVERFASAHRCPEDQVARTARALADASEGREASVGYYLLAEGREALSHRLRPPKGAFRVRLFFERNAKWLYMAFVCAVTLLIALPVLWWQGVLVALLSLLPIASLAQRLAGRLARMLARPRTLLKMDFEEGIPEQAATVVVVPTLILSAEQAREQARQLEVYHLANRSENISFMLLTDFADANAPEKEGEGAILQAARDAIDELRARYGPIFGLLHRPRTWNAAQGRYMGRERKRGALEDLNALMLGEQQDAFSVAIPPEGLLASPFVLTVDADTVLPPGCIAKLAGALAHPLNRMDEQGRGYGVLAPRMQSLPSGGMSLFQRLYSGSLGLDMYAAAASETYQDLFGEGIFSGKGIYDVRAFGGALRGKIPPNAVLSHDLLEGLYARAGLVSDVVLYDAQPRNLKSWAARLHRWTRGDWQLLPFLARGDIDALGKWKLCDNLRRSLAPAATVLAMLLGSPLYALFALFLLFGLPRKRADWLHTLVKICFLPYEAKVLVDAAARALWRTFVSHRHMLDWVTAAQADRRGSGGPPLRAMFVNALCALFALAFGPIWPAIPWLPAPFLAKRLERPAHPPQPIASRQRDFLLKVARSTYGWFENRAVREEHYLPPDNVQYKPYRGAARRTSPTNIGLALCADVAARDLGFIGEDEMLVRLEVRAQSIEKLATWNGHLYNWYSTQTLTPLRPKYVSSVDSGNYVASLWAAAAAARELHCERGDALARRLEALVHAADFTALYDNGRRQFHIGYDAENERMSNSHYDLLASEARLLSIVAIAKGDVGARHYSALGRPLTRAGGLPTLLSWSGTMFEYLMPRLFLREEAGTLLDAAARGAVAEQIRAADGRPWGESESGYYAFDLDLNYQYRAFGIPALSMRGGLPGETVVAPYASLLALLVHPDEACENLMQLESMGYLGDEGFFEAIDFTPERVPEGQSAALVCSTMAHHQGMGLLALEGAIGGKFRDRFMKLPAIRAVAPLLAERAPDKSTPARVRATREHRQRTVSDNRAGRSGKPGELHLLSGGGSSLALHPDGTGYLQHGEIALTRFRSAVNEPFGVLIYLRDADTGEAVRIGSRDCAARFEGGRALYTCPFGEMEVKLAAAVTPEDGASVFRVELLSRAAAERNLEVICYFEPVLATQRADLAHRAYMDLFVETRRAQANLLLARRRPRSREENFRLIAMIGGGDGEPHGHQTARMRFLGRRGDMAEPIGLSEGWELDAQDDWAAPIEPCAASRRSVKLAAGGRARLHFALLYGEDEDKLIADAGLYAAADGAERAFSMAATRAQVELSYLGLKAAMLRTCDRAAYVLTYPHRCRTKAQDEAAARLTAGQSELWRFGISGDLPIALVRVADVQQCAAARKIASMHEYLRHKGLFFDLILLNDYGNDYRQPVRDRLEEIIQSTHLHSLLGRSGGAHLLNAAELTPRQIDLLVARSALLIEGGAGEVEAQLPTMQRTRAERVQVSRSDRADIPLNPVATLLDNGFGGFAGEEYLIYSRPPAPWSNVIANPHFGTLVTDTGFGYTWAGNSRENKLTPWCNDPVLERHGEGIRLRDEESGQIVSIDRRCRHGQGYTTLESGALGLSSEMTVFVDSQQAIKCSSVRIANPGDAPRTLTLDAFALWTLGYERDESAGVLHTGRDGDLLYARNGYGEEGVAYLAAIGGKFLGFTCDADELWQSAQAKSLSGTASGGDPCALMRIGLDIPAGGDACVHILLGYADSVEAARAAVQGFDPARSLMDVHSHWEGLLGRISLSTPDDGMNALLNRWLPYQALSSRMWGRTAFYQAGGAYGYRDQLQDAAMLAYYDPALLRDQILRCAAHQFEQGDVQHWWHEPRRGVRTRIRDDMVFLPWAVAHYVKLTGDRSILSESVRYLSAPPLEPGQEDDYGTPALGEEGTIMEHCLRALQEACKFGEHGLPLIGGGDWNDAMNRVGIQGRGESIWLGWFLCSVLADFSALCDQETSAGMMAVRGRIADAIEQHGWDGSWYRRAYFDDGTPLGTSGSPVCEIDLIAQAWAVLSGAGSSARAREALHQAMDRLYDDKVGILKLLTPPFDGHGPDAGYIAGYVSGVRENGGQYTHGAAWGALALTALGEGERALKVLRDLMPAYKDPLIYRVEPYVAAADVYAGEHEGRGGWTWYTGSAAWLWRVAVEGICGLRVDEGVASLSPCLPDGWTVRVIWNGKNMTANAT